MGRGPKMRAASGRGWWTSSTRDRRPRAARRRRSGRPRTPNRTRTCALDPAWPLWSRVRGRSAVLVGGDPREPNRKRLEEFFELGSLERPDVAGPRKVGALVERIRRKGVDLVVVLRGFVDHKQSEPIVAAARESGVDWALADGYGATSIKVGLERFLSKEQ